MLYRLLLRTSTKLFRQQQVSFAAAPQFDAEISAIYAKVAAQHAHPKGPWPTMLRAVQAALLGSGEGAKVLDLASGPGEPALTIARHMPEATVISTDVSPDMTAKAEAAAAAAGVKNLTVQLADASELRDFGDGSVDVVTCCYGYMFPEDKQKAVEETFRVLKPGGTLVATTWDRTDILAISKDIMTAVLGKEPPPPAINPMSLAEPELFEAMLTKAGFKDLDVSTSTYPFNFTADKSLQVKIGTILLRDKLSELNAMEIAEKAFWENVHKYTTTDKEGNMIMPVNTFKLTVAKK